MGRSGSKFRLWVRRVHLYCGLALVPWVMLYAVSGVLFNHPDWSARPGGPQRFVLSDLDAIDPETVAILDTQRAAHAVARALGDDVEVLGRPAPRLRRSLRASSVADGADGPPPKLSLRFPSRRGSYGVRPEREDRVPASLAEIESVEVPGHDADAWNTFAQDVASAADPDAGAMTLDDTPTLRFVATIDGEPWQVDYAAKDGAVAFEPLADRDIRIPRLLARLHMTHVYPDALGAAWIHALIVDLTALCLAMWCITGLMMWWQLRRVRRVGWVVIVSGLAITVALLADVIPPLLS
ncbi:MAG: PepSY domain-containing protein [Myxococcota bacterium]